MKDPHRRTLLLSLTALGGCSSVYTPGYVLRTLTRQESGTDDFLWKKNITIPASATPLPTPPSSGGEAQADAALARALGGEDSAAFMQRTNTKSLLVLRRDGIALQRYAEGVGPDTPQAVFSISKSVLSLLVGRALAAGMLGSVDDPITLHLPELRARDPRFEAITLAHLLDMRSGIAFEDDLSFPFITNDAPMVYYASNLRRVALSHTRIESPPGTFNYNDYNPNLVALALERAAGADGLSQLRATFWQELGAEDEALWSVDDYGFPYWESGLVATPRDLAKIGMLVLRSEQSASPLLSAEWRARFFSAPVPASVTEFTGRDWGYRAGWWIVLRPDGHHDITAIGHFGQLIYVSPRNNTVIVRTGGDERAPNDRDLAALFFALSDQLSASI